MYLHYFFTKIPKLLRNADTRPPRSAKHLRFSEVSEMVLATSYTTILRR